LDSLIGDWYRQTADNDLQYWGLDYPPLTAYVSWIYGVFASYIYPDLVQLHTSRGIESPAGKVYMRSTVLLADILIFIPAFTYCLESLLVKSKVISKPQEKWKFTSLLLLLACLSSPSTILVDHGHFQYNGVCIGLSLWAIVAIFHGKDVVGSVLFCLALNFKQMALYYAPVFFFILLRKCIEKMTYMKSFYHLFKIGISVIFTFVALWWPFCVYAAENETCGSSLLHVLSRQFPFSRGIFEDKVANIWYCLSILCDFRQFFSIPQMARLSLCLTLILIAPIGYDLLIKKNTPTRSVLALLNCSLAFFLASFQVTMYFYI
jgi:alpha-1,3-glucosyltransferase